MTATGFTAQLLNRGLNSTRCLPLLARLVAWSNRQRNRPRFCLTASILALRVPPEMKLYSGRIPSISSEIVRSLTDGGEIEVVSAPEVELDVASVLKEYLRVDRELTDRAKDMMEQRHLPYAQFARLKRELAEQMDFGLGDEALNWICTQLFETFMHSANVDEVFADDATFRRRVKDILRKHMALEEEMDAEVRGRIKNLSEGTAAWEHEYTRVLEQIRKKHGVQQ